MSNLLRTYTNVDVSRTQIHNGNFYEFYDKFDLTASTGTKIISIKTPSTGGIGFLPPTYVSSADKLTVEYYEGATLTASTGTTITVQNHNRNSANKTGCAVLDAPTVSATGTKFIQIYMPGSTGLGGVRSGTSAGGGNSGWILKPNTVYLIKFINGSSSSNTVEINVKWCEG